VNASYLAEQPLSVVDSHASDMTRFATLLDRHRWTVVSDCSRHSSLDALSSVVGNEYRLDGRAKSEKLG